MEEQTKQTNIGEDEAFYRTEGIAIYIKGRLFYGIHPDNVENNVKMLAEGKIKFDWLQMLIMAQTQLPNK